MKDTWQLKRSPAHTWQGQRWEGHVSGEDALKSLPSQSTLVSFSSFLMSPAGKQNNPPCQKKKNPSNQINNIFNKIWIDTMIGACRKLLGTQSLNRLLQS